MSTADHADDGHPQLFIRRTSSAWDGERYVGPKILAYHVQQPAPAGRDALLGTVGAPRFTPDGKAVLYTSDLTAYSNMYLVEVGEIDDN